jgi:hypothetical protein
MDDHTRDFIDSRFPGELALAKRRVRSQLDRVVALAESGRYTADAELALIEAETALALLEGAPWPDTVSEAPRDMAGSVGGADDEAAFIGQVLGESQRSLH